MRKHGLKLYFYRAVSTEKYLFSGYREQSICGMLTAKNGIEAFNKAMNIAKERIGQNDEQISLTALNRCN